MKINRIILLLVFAFSCNIYIYAQNTYRVDEVLNKSQLSEVEQAVKLYWKWDKVEEPLEAIKLLEKISQKDPNNWVAPYWAAYISTQLINSDKKYANYLDKAQMFMDMANKAFAKKTDKTAEPYFHALQALIYRFQSFKYRSLKDKKNYELFNEKSKQELNAGIKLDSDNPVLMVLVATDMGSNSDGDFGKIIASISLLEKAQTEFRKIKDRSPADITYWNEHWIKFWLGRLKPPQSK